MSIVPVLDESPAILDLAHYTAQRDAAPPSGEYAYTREQILLMLGKENHAPLSFPCPADNCFKRLYTLKEAHSHLKP